MDMRRHLKSWLTIPTLRERGGTYDGTIASVREEEVRNAYKQARELQPVIAFEDGARVIPNIGMRRELVAHYGPDTDHWVGRPRQVFLRPMARHNPDDTKPVRYEKAVAFPDQPQPISEPGSPAPPPAVDQINWS